MTIFCHGDILQPMFPWLSRDAAGEALAHRPLDKAAIGRAYTLVRNLAPGITLERWSRYARPQIASKSAKWPHGLMTIRNQGGYILALFAFGVRDDLHDSRTLSVNNIMVANIPGRDRIWASVVDAAEALAKDNGCRVIRAELTGDLDPSESDRAWIKSSLEASGYAPDGFRAFKRARGLPAQRAIS